MRDDRIWNQHSRAGSTPAELATEFDLSVSQVKRILLDRRGEFDRDAVVRGLRLMGLGSREIAKVVNRTQARVNQILASARVVGVVDADCVVVGRSAGDEETSVLFNPRKSIGVVDDVVSLASGDRVAKVITDPDAIYSVRDPNRRRAGDLLRIVSLT